MRKKCNILALCSFIISAAVLIFTYFFYHYIGPNCLFTYTFNEMPTKPFVSMLLGVLGVMFLFAGIISLIAGKVFFSEKKQ